MGPGSFNGNKLGNSSVAMKGASGSKPSPRNSDKEAKKQALQRLSKFYETFKAPK